MKKMFASIQWLGPGKPPHMISSETETRSGVKSDALLYLGPPDTLTESPWEPSIYLDLDYFKEMQRRAQCCVPIPSSLDWEEIVQQNSALPRKAVDLPIRAIRYTSFGCSAVRPTKRLKSATFKVRMWLTPCTYMEAAKRASCTCTPKMPYWTTICRHRG